MVENRTAYEKKEIAQAYSERIYLDKAEKSILNFITNKAADYRMLDIGCGGGRTTHFFAPVMRQYVGIDYSNSMVEVCAERYKHMPNVSIKLADARDLSMFPDNSFDFVLFSFNGIDCVSFEDRVQILKEIRRVGKKWTRIAFSSHNMYNIPLLFSFQMRMNVFKWIAEYQRTKGVNEKNPSIDELMEKDWTPVIDGDQNFNTSYIYIKPETQIKQLQDLGFTNIDLFSVNSGSRIKYPCDWSAHDDPWLYYYCTNNK